MSDARWSLLLFAAAFLVRLVACLGTALFGTDGGHYLLMADGFRQGRFHEALAVGYHPMYPLLIAAMRTFTGTTEAAGNAVSVLLGSAAVLPLYRMVLAVFSRPVAVLAVLLYAFQPAIIEVESEVMTEATFIFFLFSSQWMTWKMIKEPRADRGALAGAASAAAFLTRPEGILAIVLALGWAGLPLLGRSGARARRLGGLAVMLCVIVLAVLPYMLWIRSSQGRWRLSPRNSVASAERELGVGETGTPESTPHSSARYYGHFAKSVFRLSVYGLWLPFAALGLRSVRRPGAIFYFSLPLAHLGAILVTLRTHAFMSDRYIMAPMTLLGAVVACGLLSALAFVVRSRPESPRRLAIAGAVLAAVTVLPAIRIFKIRRAECLSYPVAAARILQENPHPRGMSGPVEQVAYLCGARSYYSAASHEGIRDQIEKNHVDYYVYSEKDVTGRPEYVSMLESCPYLAPAVEVDGPPGTLKVYYQRSK